MVDGQAGSTIILIGPPSEKPSVRRIGSAASTGAAEDHLHGISRPVPHGNVSAILKPMRLRIGEALQGSVRRPGQAHAILAPQPIVIGGPEHIGVDRNNPSSSWPMPRGLSRTSPGAAPWHSGRPASMHSRGMERSAVSGSWQRRRTRRAPLRGAAGVRAGCRTSAHGSCGRLEGWQWRRRAPASRVLARCGALVDCPSSQGCVERKLSRAEMRSHQSPTPGRFTNSSRCGVRAM